MTFHYSSTPPPPQDFSVLFSTTGWNEEYHLTTEELMSAISKSWRTVAVYDDERLVGFGRIVSDGILHAMIYDLIVHPEYQGRGIGDEMLKRLVASCRAAGIRDIQLFCARGKREFYEKRGFRARADDAPGMDHVRG
jgi:ribosomal protein S18 acetylase RimI-like enzyme